MSESNEEFQDAPTGKSRPPTIAYLTGCYARASDSFIRTEVAELRELGHVVHTFSIRKSPESEAVSEDVRRERATTEYVVQRSNLFPIAWASIAAFFRSPWKLLKLLRLAIGCSPPGIKARFLAICYVAEGCFIAARIKRNGIEHLHNHIAEGSAVVAMVAASLSGIGYSLTIHGTGEFDRAVLLALDKKIASAVFVVTVSHYGRGQVLRWSRPQDWPRIKIVHCAVEERYLQQTPTPPPHEPRLVFVGRLDSGKGLLQLIEAAAELAEDGVPFVLSVVGDGPFREEADRLIADKALQDKVEMLGWATSATIQREILGSRALILPSLAENLPLVLMEALALARPAISTNVGAIPELIRTGETGWLIPAGSTAALASAMREALAASEDALLRMGRAGAALVRERHQGRAEAEKLSRLLRGATGEAISEPGWPY